jgi:hypothetical protein
MPLPRARKSGPSFPTYPGSWGSRKSGLEKRCPSNPYNDLIIDPQYAEVLSGMNEKLKAKLTEIQENDLGKTIH